MTKRSAIPQGMRFNVLRRDAFACRYCGRSSPAVELHLDHVKPVAAGGETTEQNLITACSECNIGKSAKLEVEPPVLTVKSGAGLVGLYGHTYEPSEDPAFAGLVIKYQFSIIRELPGDRIAVQLYSFMSGDPTDVMVWPAAAIDDPHAKLYTSAQAWRAAYEVFARNRWGR